MNNTRKFRHLNYQDRKKIEKMLKENMRVTVIANVIGVHRATIYKELKRGGSPYSADNAQKMI